MKLPVFTDEQVVALRAVVDLWGLDAVVLIGASALGCSIDMRWRKTYDLDLSVSISIDDYPAGLEQLEGWTQHPRTEHEWLSPKGVRVDILPSGEDLLDAGEVVWPKSGFRMSLAGLRHAFAESELLELQAGFEIRVAPLPVIALLKIVAYSDRPAERDRDLQDLSYLLDQYLADDEERRFAPDIIAHDLSFEDTCAFLLGKDIGALVDDNERGLVLQFLARLQDEHDPTAARMIRSAPVLWREDPEILEDRVRAFTLGFEEVRSSEIG